MKTHILYHMNKMSIRKFVVFLYFFLFPRAASYLCRTLLSFLVSPL